MWVGGVPWIGEVRQSPGAPVPAPTKGQPQGVGKGCGVIVAHVQRFMWGGFRGALSHQPKMQFACLGHPQIMVLSEGVRCAQECSRVHSPGGRRDRIDVGLWLTLRQGQVCHGIRRGRAMDWGDEVVTAGAT